jgi:DNA-binding transcriptional MerR regulator
MEILRSKSIQQIAKITKTQLDHWINIRAIKPFEDNRGRGKVRLFSFQNLVETLICRKLNKFGTSGDRIKKVLEYLRREEIIESEIRYYEQRIEWESSLGKYAFVHKQLAYTTTWMELATSISLKVTSSFSSSFSTMSFLAFLSDNFIKFLNTFITNIYRRTSD